MVSDWKHGKLKNKKKRNGEGVMKDEEKIFNLILCSSLSIEVCSWYVDACNVLEHQIMLDLVSSIIGLICFSIDNI